MDPIYPDFPSAPSIPKVAPLSPDRLDPDQRRERDSDPQPRKRSDDEEETDEAVIEDISAEDEPAQQPRADAVKLRGDPRRRDGDGDDGHIDISV